MKSERFERALREWPPDEPTYLPGGHRGSGQRRWWFAAASVSVGLALVVGVVIGLGLDVLRGDRAGGPAPRVLVADDLQGVWESARMTYQVWEEALRAEGFTQDNIDAFLEHDPFENEVRYALHFIDGVLVVRAAYDDQPLQTLNGGTFNVDSAGVVHISEVVDGAAIGCEISALVTIEAERLEFRMLDLPGCDVDERMANTLFFDIASYERVEN